MHRNYITLELIAQFLDNEKAGGFTKFCSTKDTRPLLISECYASGFNLWEGDKFGSNILNILKVVTVDLIPY